MFFLWILTLLYAALAELLLPAPCSAQDFLGRRLSLPAKYLVGLVDSAPHLFDVTLTTRRILPVYLHTGSLLETFDHLKR